MALQQALSERSQSLARTLKKRLSANKPSEVAQLKPVALAGASNKFQGPSQLCSAFAPRRCAPLPLLLPPLPSDGDDGEKDCQFIELAGEPSAPRHATAQVGGDVRSCRMCAQAFVQSHTSAHRYPEFCSLDCKSAFLLGANMYARDADESESSTVASPGSRASDSAPTSTSSDSSSQSSHSSRSRPRRQWV